MTQLHNDYINHSPYKLGQFGDQLENMTAQEVFNIAVEHLLLQNKQSIKTEDGYTACIYNGGGVCCAAAPFIKNYNESMENQGWRDICQTDEHKALISNLQITHDHGDGVTTWPSRLQATAERFKLEMPQILIDKLNAK